MNSISSFLSYFNPFSTNHDAIKKLQENNFSRTGKVAICAVSFFAGLATFGIGGVAIFRCLVNHFSKTPPESQKETIETTQNIVKVVLETDGESSNVTDQVDTDNDLTQKEEESFFDCFEELPSKVSDDTKTG